MRPRSSLPTNPPFHEPNILAFASDDTSTSFNFVHSIVDLSHPVPEPNLSFYESIFNGWFGIPFQDTFYFTHVRSQPNLSFYESIFNGWFGIPFQDTFYFTHVRSPRLSKILTLDGLSALISFYSTILFSIPIRSFVLHMHPLRVTKDISHIFLFHIPSPAITSPTHQCISNCVTLQPLPVKDQRDYAYQSDPDTKVLIDRLSINISLNEPTILKFPAAYRTTIARNLLGLIEGIPIFYEPLHTITKHIFCIVVLKPFRHIIFNLMHATSVAGPLGEYKPCIGFVFDFLASLTF